jgi:acetyl-CoA/propionyl-CoA carboxylase
MRNALDEFVIEGINTTIPLYKTIMEEPNFIKGDLSTDYLDRFKLFDKMNEEVRSAASEKAQAAVAAALLHGELSRKGTAQNSGKKLSAWKMRGSA